MDKLTGRIARINSPCDILSIKLHPIWAVALIAGSRLNSHMKESRSNRPRLLVLGGVTASGKTSASLRLARFLPVEIVSADSVSVYKGLDIGSAKPSIEQQRAVRHHLLDVVTPDEAMTAAIYGSLAQEAITDIISRDKYPVLVGGTGLYIRTVLHGLVEAPNADKDLRNHLRQRESALGHGTLHEELSRVDPVTAERLHPSDLVRIVRALEVYINTGKTISVLQKSHRFREKRYDVSYYAFDPGVEVLHRRIAARVEEMLEKGLIEEALGLLELGYSPSLRSLSTPGYRQAFEVLAGRMTLDEAFESICRDHRRYARRQRVWFRSVEGAVHLPGPDHVDYAAVAGWMQS